REVEEHLDLDAATSRTLVLPRLIPAGARPFQRLDGLARTMQLLETVAAAEQTEMIGRKRGERAIVPAERLRPLLLALEVPADGAMKDRRAARRQLRAPQQVAFDLVLVAEHAERAPDLVDELRGVPGFALRQVVQSAVARHDQVMLTPGRQGANLREDRVQVAHPLFPSPGRPPSRLAAAGGPSTSQTANAVVDSSRASRAQNQDQRNSKLSTSRSPGWQQPSVGRSLAQDPYAAALDDEAPLGEELNRRRIYPVLDIENSTGQRLFGVVRRDHRRAL